MLGRQLGLRSIRKLFLPVDKADRGPDPKYRPAVPFVAPTPLTVKEVLAQSPDLDVLFCARVVLREEVWDGGWNGLGQR
jgi:hypothetical protein